MPKGFSRTADVLSRRPSSMQDDEFKERTTGWALFPDQREDSTMPIDEEAIKPAIVAKLLKRGAEPKYLYHVTYMNRLNSIAEEGLQPNQRASIGGAAYDFNRSGRVFLTEAKGVDFWLSRAKDFAYHESDNAMEEGYVPIVLRTKWSKRLQAEVDDIGSGDAGAQAYAVKKPIPPDALEYWATNWWPVSGTFVTPEEYQIGGDEEGYLKNDASIFHPNLSV